MALTKRRYTFEDWLVSPDICPLSELVEGEPVERMPTTPDHGRIVRRLEHWLFRAEEAGLGEVYTGPVAVLLDAGGPRRNAREPDLCFVRRERLAIVTRKAVEGLPDLVIEVRSPTNRADDLPDGPVFEDYRRFGVPVYWIVDPESRTVTQWTRRDGMFTVTAVSRTGDRLAFLLFPELTLPVDDLFRGIPE